MPFLPTEEDTKDWESIEKYLLATQDNIESANNQDVVPYILPIFKSNSTSDPVVMMKFHRWLDQHVSTDLRYIVTENIKELMESDMNNYKFKIVLGMRGPMSDDLIIEFVKANDTHEDVKEIVKHSDFPTEARNYMLEMYPTVTEYMSKEAQEMFVF